MLAKMREIANPAQDVLARVEDVAYLHTLGRARHELHQALSADPRDGARIVITFDLDDRAHQLFGDLIEGGRLANDIVVAAETLARGITGRHARAAARTRAAAATLTVFALHVQAIAVVAAGHVGEIHRPVAARVAVDIGEARYGEQREPRSDDPQPSLILRIERFTDEASTA